MKKRKLTAVIATGLAAALSLAACSSQRGRPAETTAAPEQKREEIVSTTEAVSTAEVSTAAEEPAGKITRDEIILGGKADIKSTDPAGQPDVYSAILVRHIYSPLVKIDKDGASIVGDLAESFDMPDDKTYHFVLRKGVKFHDGTELKASDVKFTLERAREMASTKSTASYFDTITVDNDYEITLKLNTPFSGMLYLLTNPNLHILSEKAVTEAGDQYVELPVGTGPFKYVEWSPNDHWTIERNDDYYGERPFASKITYRVIVEDSARVIALETGEIDMALGISEIESENVEANPELVLESGPSPAIEYIGMNLRNEYLSNQKVRQAIAYALDKQVFVDTIIEGKGMVANSYMGRTIPGWDKDLEAYPYDPEKAKELLAEAGYPNGFPIQINVSGDERNRVAQIVQAQLADVGIKVEINMYEWGALLDMLQTGDNEMYVLGWNNSWVDPERSMTPMFHGNYCGANGNNYAFLQNDELDALLDQAAAEPDNDKRIELYKEAQAMLRELVPIVPLYYRQNLNGRRADLKGFEFDKNTSHYFGNLHYEE